jgi:tetratricopeptide (TPR) repeat protein
MPTLSHLQLPPPKTWQDFETLCCDLWRAIWSDPNAKKNGRQGQIQHGVDVFGNPSQSILAGVQCKGKDNYTDKTLSEKELRAEVQKAKSFLPALSQFTLATTGTRDAHIQQVARLLSDEHQTQNLFSVDVWSWEDIVESFESHPEVVARHYPDYALTTTVQHGFDQVQATQRDVLQQQVHATEAIKSHVDVAVSRVVASLPDSMLDAFTAIHDNAIALAREYLNNNRPAQALEYLDQQKKVIWATATPMVKARLLAAMGAAHLGLAQEKRAAELFLEARQYAPDDEKTLTNVAVGYLLLGDLQTAHSHAQSVVQKNPTNYHAQSVAIQTSEEPLTTILEGLPPYCRENRDVAFALGAVATRQGSFEQAEHWCRVALEKSTDVQPEIKGALGQAILHRLMEDKASTLPIGQIGTELREPLEEAENLLSDAWAETPEDMARRPRVAWIINLGMVRRFLGKLEHARLDFEAALRLDADHPVAKYFSAILAEDICDFERALHLVESIGSPPELPQVPLFVADLLRQVRGPDAAIQYLNKRIHDGLPPPVESAARLFVVKVLESQSKFQEAIGECESMLNAEPSDVRLLVIASKLQRHEGNGDVADALLAKAQQCVENATPAFHTLALADELYDLKRVDDAAAVYERVVVPSLDTWLTHRYLNACFEASRFEKALEVCQSLTKAHGPIRHVVELESVIYEEIGDLPASCRVCDEYLQLHPDDGLMRVRRAVVHLRQRNTQEIDAFLAAPPDWESLPVNGAIQIANLFAVRERYKEATELLYRIRRKHPAGQTYLRYMQSLLFHGVQAKEWLEVDEVAPDVAVCVEDEAGNRHWFILEDAEDANLEKGELPKGHSLREELLGKKQGQRILLRQSAISPEYGTIIEIKSKYVHALHECGATLQTRYPEVKGFESYHLPKGEDPENAIKKILEQVGKRHDAHRHALELYRDNLIPIAAFGSFVGLDVFEAWSVLISDRNSRLHSCAGAHDERRQAIVRLGGSPQPMLVIDPVALMTIAAIGVRDEIVRIVGTLGIAQATIDLISESLHQLKAHNREGFMTLHKEGDQFYRQDVSAEQIEQKVKWWEELLRWISVNCVVLPLPLGAGVNRHDRQKYDQVLGDATVDTILAASEHDRLLYSDDFALRILAKAEHQVDGVWTQAVLMRGVEAGTTDENIFNQAAIGLACGGYRHTMINSAVLLDAARKADWRVATPYEEVAVGLGGKNCDEDSAVRVVVDFLYRLWQESILPQRFGFLTMHVLDALASHRPLRPLIDKLVLMTKERFRLVPIAGRQVLRLLQAWLSLRITEP